MTIYVDACGCTNTCRHCSVSGAGPYRQFYSYEELLKIVAV